MYFEKKITGLKIWMQDILTDLSEKNRQRKNNRSYSELTSCGYGNINEDSGKSHACFCLSGKFIKIDGVLAELHGLEYEMPYTYDTREIRISDDSETRMALLDKDGNAIKIITDKKFREYEFDESGNLNSNWQ